MLESAPDLVGAAIGGGGGAWVAVRLLLASMNTRIDEAHAKAERAHSRIDSVLMRGNGK